MRDCNDDSMRDLLPDLLHERVDRAVRADVERHLAACESCASEFALLREFRGELSQRPRLDAEALGSSVQARLGRPLRRSRASALLADWRMAAAITLVAGGAYLAGVAVRRGDDDASAGVRDTAAASGATAVMQVALVRMVEGAAELSLHEMTDSELAGLVEQIDAFDGLHPEGPATLINLPESE